MSGVQLTENLIKTLDGGGKDDDSSFIPAPGGFQGPRDGYIFQNGEAGVGYYREEIFAAKEDDDDDDDDDEGPLDRNSAMTSSYSFKCCNGPKNSFLSWKIAPTSLFMKST